MFGISGGEFLVLLVIAALVMGPKNVAQILHGLRKLLDTLRSWSAQLRNEAGMDLSSFGIDPAEAQKLKNFDLRQYDPRQMVREAVQEEMNAWLSATSNATKVGKETAAGAASTMQQAAAPFPPDTFAQSAISANAGYPVPQQPAAPVSPVIPNPAEPPATSTPSDTGPIDLHTILNHPELGGA